MEALVWLGGDQLVLEDVPSPETNEDETLFRVSLAGICGSDLHAFRGAGGKRIPPLILGHEAVGHVEGDDRFFVVFPLEGCGKCEACAKGRENLCVDRRLLGLDRPGTFAQEVTVPTSSLLAVPGGLSADLAALTEPLATSLALFGGVTLDSNTELAVIGCGSIGLLAMYAASQAGCSIIATDPLEERREAALALGATRVTNSADEFAPAGADMVIDAVGIEATWSAGIRAVKAGGDVVVVGLGQSSGNVEIGDLVRRGITLRGSYAYTRDDFVRALEMLAAHPPSAAWLTRLPLSQGADAFASLVEKRSPAIKILLEP